MKALAEMIGIEKFKTGFFNYSNTKDANELWNSLNELVFDKRLVEVGVDIMSRNEAIRATADFFKTSIDKIKPPKTFYGSYLPDYKFYQSMVNPNKIVARFHREMFILVTQTEPVPYPLATSVVAHEMIHEYDANYGEDHEIAEAEFLTNKKFDSHDTPTFRKFMNMLNNEGIEIRPHTDNLSHEELSYSAMKKAMSLLEEKEFSTSNLPKHSDPNGRWIYNPVDDSYGFPKWY